MTNSASMATAPSATELLEKNVNKGMAYADFRSKALALGWKPQPDPQCRANVVGQNHLELCAENPDLPLCKACDDMPELSTYSGDGHSLSYFVHPDGSLKLAVTGLGELKDWSVSGEDSGLQVLSWEVTPTQPATE